MEQGVHCQIVRAAFDYLWNGIDDEKRVISSYRANRPEMADHLPFYTYSVDEYYDLAVSGCGKDGIFVANSHHTSPLNHFLFAFAAGGCWSDGSYGSLGYSYCRSPRTDEDRAIGEAVEWGASVDYGHSLVLENVKRWFSDPLRWASNWDASLEYTEFVPANILAAMYYRALLRQQELQISQPGYSMEAEGCDIAVNSTFQWTTHLKDLELLGPVLHLIGDVCVPHHIGGTFGCGHKAWEDLVASECGSGYPTYSALGLYDRAEVTSQLDRPDWVNYSVESGDIDSDGLEGTLSPEKLLVLIAKKTMQRICKSTATPPSVALERVGHFLKEYTARSPEYAADRVYLFNLAVAGSVLLLKSALNDLVRLNIFKATEVTIPPPEKDLISATAPRPHRTMAFSSEAKWPIRGFDKIIDRLNGTFDVKNLEELDVGDAMQGLKIAERFLLRRFVAGYRNRGAKHCPIAVDMKRVFSGIDPIEGLGTFRLPTIEEGRESLRWAAYLNEKRVYTFKSRLFEMVFFIAALRAAQFAKRGDEGRIAAAVASLQKSIRDSLNARTIAARAPDVKEVARH